MVRFFVSSRNRYIPSFLYSETTHQLYKKEKIVIK